jgi:hypothetical protein
LIPIRFASLVACLLLIALTVACSGKGETPPPPTATVEPPAPTATASPAPRPASVRPDAQPFPDDLRQSSLELFGQIAALRNSPPRHEVDMFLLSREQARAFYARPAPAPADASASLPTATPGPPRPRPIDVKQEVYELLGLVPEQRATEQPSLQQSQTDNLISLITGFYSPEHDAFYMLDSLSGGIYGTLAKSTIVHELTHALQYQYVDIDRVSGERANDWDATTALLDVIEGDAVNTENVLLGYSTRSTYRQPVCFAIPAPQRAGTSYVVERELDTWYEDGLCFIQAVSRERPIADVFANLPTTTEQILHPEKYFAGEGRRPVALQPLDGSLGEGWMRPGNGRFGEFMVQNILLAGLAGDRSAVQTAAAGWGGDAWSLYVNGESRLLQAVVSWDASEDARQFWDALTRSVRTDGEVTVDAALLSATRDGKTWRARVEGDTVWFAVTNDVLALERVSGDLGLQ